MTKWINNEGKIFDHEWDARDYCYDSETEDDLIEAVKNCVENYWRLFLDALQAHDSWEYQKLCDDILDEIWARQGFREIEVEDEENEN